MAQTEISAPPRIKPQTFLRFRTGDSPKWATVPALRIPFMNSTLLKSAVALVPETELLVNMVRLRVRQLSQGQRPLIAAPPGMGLADIALSEIAEGKLTSAPEPAPVRGGKPATVIAFPGGTPEKKAA